MGRLGAARGASGSADMRVAGPKQGHNRTRDAVSQLAQIRGQRRRSDLCAPAPTCTFVASDFGTAARSRVAG
jgi:hypothetical protein